MKNYSVFTSALEFHLSQKAILMPEQWVAESYRYVNGLADSELRRLVDLGSRRHSGAFFTNSELATQLFESSGIEFPEGAVLYDPASGAGNLLLAGQKFLAKNRRNYSILGTDIHQEFVDTAKLRLTINSNLLLDQSLAAGTVELKLADSFLQDDYYGRATHIVVNPPFNQLSDHAKVEWGKGKISAAALFIDRITSYVRPGTVILALLPDVLRSGSRYRAWREIVSERCTLSNLRKLGQFDKFADVDVFSIVMVKKAGCDDAGNSLVWNNRQDTARSVRDFYNVSVGSVVDNRDQHTGPERPFIISRGLPGWLELSTFERCRLFSGKSVKSPFIVIKRTSRIGDKHRAIATIINFNEPVFVDNHLIVVRPKDESILSCRLLLKKLRQKDTDDWLNEQIRCRHLTVEVISDIPYEA